MSKKKHLIIYHKEDNDGVFSAAILYDYITSELGIDDTDIELYPATYNDMNGYELDYLVNNFEHISILDLSFNDPMKMKNLFKMMGPKLTWIDHHKPAIMESIAHKYDGITGVRNSQHSTIVLTYQYLYDEFGTNYQFYPEIYKALSAWDSWSWEACGYDFERIKSINMGVTISYQLGFISILSLVKAIKNTWSDDRNRDWLIQMDNKGHEYNSIKEYENRMLIENYGDLTWEIDFPKHFNNRSACAIFIQGPTNSQIFKSIKDTIDNGIVFKRMPNGDWNISLYNTRDDHDFHCGTYLKEKYGGGGHEGAAGCTISEKKFMKLLKSKTL